MLEELLRLHQCADCPIRCQAMKHPRSIFARIHGWHHTWWPGWKIYQRQLHAERMMRVMQAVAGTGMGNGKGSKDLGVHDRRPRSAGLAPLGESN